MTQGRPMKSVRQYQDQAKEFERLADRTAEASLRRHYADMAACYRLLAQERLRMIESGEIPAGQSDRKQPGA
jgi:hypothetical protein